MTLLIVQWRLDINILYYFFQFGRIYLDRIIRQITKRIILIFPPKFIYQSDWKIKIPEVQIIKLMHL
jgi:hypothetical protein